MLHGKVASAMKFIPALFLILLLQNAPATQERAGLPHGPEAFQTTREVKELDSVSAPFNYGRLPVLPAQSRLRGRSQVARSQAGSFSPAPGTAGRGPAVPGRSGEGSSTR